MNCRVFIALFSTLTITLLTNAALASDPIYKCASDGSGAENSFRLNIFTSSEGILKANLLEGQSTANTWVTYTIESGACTSGNGICNGESKTNLQGSTFKFHLLITGKAASNMNRSGVAAVVTAEAFDLRRPAGNQRLAFNNVAIVCTKQN